MKWLDRQSFLGDDSTERLDAFTVGIVGLGGGGSHVAQQLAHIGIGHFVLVDDDVIDESNLNRLVGGTRADVEQSARKVDIAARVILAVNPHARVTRIAQRWQLATDPLKLCDAIFGGVDSVRAKDELEAFCRRLLIPYLDQGMDVHDLDGQFLIAGQVVLSVPGGPCLRCLGVVTEEALDGEGRNYGAAGGKPQVVWPNGVLASTAVGLFLQMVTPWHRTPEQGACLEYDGNTQTVRASDRMQRLRDRGCPHCPIGDVGDPSFDVRKLPARPTAPETPAPAASTPRAAWPLRVWRDLLDKVLGR
ncbi:HesA/MoeB/ThiF family protein [Altererythrobacter sp. Root672]|uniref:HesA/MoeB/ThiF family protein n=1 Tax=Altererythrobacter sp. Root672 TaxID=1736584 RepID=UPI0009E6F2E6|nr:ThiF family adenylyltransferase [Altererythrobacter sp. Root672]